MLEINLENTETEASREERMLAYLNAAQKELRKEGED